MSNRSVGLALLTIGVGMLAGTFGLGILVFLNPRMLADFSVLFPEGRGLLRVATYFVAIALLWVLGSTASKILSHGLGLVRSESGSPR